MCGIIGAWAREDHIPKDVINILFKHNENRGRDGYGYCYANPTENRKSYRKPFSLYRSAKPYSEEQKVFGVARGNLMLGICRAKPETEVATNENDLERTMQPIIRDQYVLVHNGAINTYFEDCYKQQKTLLDSECILIQYQKYGFPKFVEHIAGGFAFLLYDPYKNYLVMAVNHMPIYHMYIRGIGYFVSSVKAAFDEILEYYFRVKKDSINVWESWYHTQVTAFTVRSTDLEAGMTMYQNFKPIYLVGDKVINAR